MKKNLENLLNKLFIVATPIGNLDDMTFRAVEVLKKVDYIACEDSRVTKILLHHFDIKNKKLLIHHNYNEHKSAQGLIDLLLKGYSIALVSDAGMPTVADPGFLLIKLALQNNLDVQVVPGPSAVIMSNILANFSNTFTFLGFLKPKSGERINQLKTLIPGVYVTFVSRYKLLKTLMDLETVFGPQLEIFLGKELTKIYEQHYRGFVKDIREQLQNKEPRGEYTLIFKIQK